MTLGAAYENHADFDLIRLQPSRVDTKISEFVTAYAEADGPRRGDIRAALSEADGYTLVTFARRRAVQSLRSSNADLAVEGLLGLAAVDPERIDYRDLSWAIGLAQHAIWTGGADVDAALTHAAELAGAGGSDSFSRYVGAPDDLRSLRAQGFRPVHTADGLGLIDDWGHRYEPRVDLASITLAIVDVVEADGYPMSSVTTGVELPDVWLRGGDPRRVHADLRALRACTSIHCDTPGELQVRQMLLVFVAECEGGDAAERLAAAAMPEPTADHSAVAVTHDALVCVVIGRALVHGGKSVETQESLRRFVVPIQAALAAGVA